MTPAEAITFFSAGVLFALFMTLMLQLLYGVLRWLRVAIMGGRI